MAPDTDIKFVKGIGPARALLLRDELGIKTAGDLVRHYRNSALLTAWPSMWRRESVTGITGMAP